VKQNTVAAFGGAIPENYDRYLGPVLFEPYAHDLAGRLPKQGLKNVLEVACGTGIVTRRLRDALPRETSFIATDLNSAMLNFAARKFQTGENVKWQEADASALPFPDQSFDAVVSQFGLMFVPDKDRAQAEAFRVLRPGGIQIFNVWDSFAHNDLPRTTHEVIASFFDRDPPTFYQTPFGYHNRDVIRNSLEGAGFREVEVEAVTLPCRSTSADELAIGLVRGNPVSLMIEERGANIDEILRKVAVVVGEKFGKQPVATTMRALVWRAVRP
jgi:ubiquinone/menaquinone biosynthesis C-methylase UbiE